jgi:ERF superfamily
MSEEAKNVAMFNAPLTPERAPTSILDIIDRAASDPRTNVDNLERLLGMYERIKAGEARAAYIAAMVKMKPLLPVIDRRGRITIHEKGKDKTPEHVIQSTPYALWEDIDEKITPVLAAHGFSLTFRSGVAHDGKITVTGILGHEGGHSEETTITLPHDSSGSKNAVQAVGSSTSYGKRYTATMLLNIRTKGEDDDGTKGGEPSTISEDQIQTIRDMIDRGKADVEAFCKYMGVAALADIPRGDYEKAITALNLKLAKKKP